MSNGYDSLVAHLESRYDYHSARVIAKETLSASGLEEAKDLGAKEMDKILAALGTLGYDAEAVSKSVNGGGESEAAPAADDAADDAAEEKPAAKKAAAKKAAKPKAKAKKK